MPKFNNLQDIFLLRARRERVPVTVFLMTGFQMRGTITGLDAFVVILDSEGRQQVIYKHAISTIIPILTGDLEKISRLKNTFTMATTGTELINPRLQRFIFDSSLATKTDDIENLLRHDGYIYKDLCNHLLNARVNESQKQAIIKAMLANDLAYMFIDNYNDNFKRDDPNRIVWGL